MLRKGSEKFKIEPPLRVTVEADGEFTVFSLRGNKREAIVGPRKVSDRYSRCDLRGDVDGVEIRVKPNCLWAMNVEPLANGERVDNTPVEVPVGYGHPTPLREQMKMWIREEMSAAAEEAGEETFEEADDFDVDDADEVDIISPYELSELQEEFVDPEVDGGEDPPAEDPPVESRPVPPDKPEVGKPADPPPEAPPAS